MLSTRRLHFFKRRIDTILKCLFAYFHISNILQINPNFDNKLERNLAHRDPMNFVPKKTSSSNYSHLKSRYRNFDLPTIKVKQ